MPLFGSKEPSTARVQVLTLAYIVEGTADDGNVITQEGTNTRFERTSGAGGFQGFPTHGMEKPSLQALSGNDTGTTGPRVTLPMSLDAHPGHDAACFYDFMRHNPPFANEVPDYLHISRTILPALLERGVTQAQIDELLIENPQRFFGP